MYSCSYRLLLPDLYKALGVYLDLVVVFAIILARAESVASKNGVVVSFLDGMGMGIGFTIAMFLISFVREILGQRYLSLVSLSLVRPISRL